MVYWTVSLKDMIEQVGSSWAKNAISNFSCEEKNKDVDDFIKNKAIKYEQVGLSRTYFIYVEVSTELSVICAMFSIAIKPFKYPKKSPKSIKRLHLGTSFPLGENIPSILIGQLSKNYNSEYNRHITGETLMGLINTKIIEMHELTPSACISVECENQEILRTYYEDSGFIFLTMRKELCLYIMSTNTFVSPEYRDVASESKTI